MPSRTHSAGCSTEIRGSGPASTFAGVVLAHVAPEAATRDLRGCVVVAVVAPSVSPLYAAGARDEGLAVVELDDDAFCAAAGPDAGVAVDLETGTVRIDGRAFAVAAATPHERAVRQAGGIVAHLRVKWNADPEPAA